MDLGAGWTTLHNFTSFRGGGQIWQWLDAQSASVVALGKAKCGASYSAGVNVVGVINGMWGLYRSDDAATWTRFNDDAHQLGGFGKLAADQDVNGGIYAAGSCRGRYYSN